jgi:uncharacterized membrane protein YccC
LALAARGRRLDRLWPQWERERLPTLLARAIHANRNYMVQVFAALGGAALPSERIGEFRRQAEIATGNADAGFQRLLSEPRMQRGRIARAFALLTYVQRLERHLIALASYVGGISLPESELRALLSLLEATQEDVAKAAAEDRIPLPYPPFDVALGRLRSTVDLGASNVSISAQITLGDRDRLSHIRL